MGKTKQFKVYSIVEITNGIKVIEEKILNM